MIDAPDPIELEAIAVAVQVGEDKRPRLEVPPPVRLVAVEDCLLDAPAGLEVQLDHFYVSLLKFERQTDRYDIVYRAENLRLRINVMERPPNRENFRMLGLAVPSLNELANALFENKVEFIRQRGLAPGMDELLVYDPAGNPLQISEYRVVI